MKNAVVKNNFLVFLILFIIISCKITVNKVDNNSTTNDTVAKQYDYSNIETNSHNENFDFELINTLPVKKGDSILFRKWGVIDDKSLILKDNDIKFKIQNSKYVNYYKTGENRFSRCKITLKNNSNDIILPFYSYVNYGDINDINRDYDPYDSYNIRSSYKLIRINDSLARFDFSRSTTGDFYMNFQIKNKEIHITKIVENPNYFNENHYELDTLIIINRKNNLINVSKLYEITHNKRNLKK